MSYIALAKSFIDPNDVYWSKQTTRVTFTCTSYAQDKMVIMMPESHVANLREYSQLFIYCPNIPEVILISITRSMYENVNNFVIRFPLAGGYVVHLGTDGSFIKRIKIILPTKENGDDAHCIQTTTTTTTTTTLTSTSSSTEEMMPYLVTSRGKTIRLKQKREVE